MGRPVVDVAIVVVVSDDRGDTDSVGGMRRTRRRGARYHRGGGDVGGGGERVTGTVTGAAPRSVRKRHIKTSPVHLLVEVQRMVLIYAVMTRRVLIIGGRDFVCVVCACVGKIVVGSAVGGVGLGRMGMQWEELKCSGSARSHTHIWIFV